MQFDQVPREDHAPRDREAGYAGTAHSVHPDRHDERGNEREEPGKLDGEDHPGPGEHDEVVIGELEEDTQGADARQPDEDRRRRRPLGPVGEIRQAAPPTRS